MHVRFTLWLLLIGLDRQERIWKLFCFLYLFAVGPLTTTTTAFPNSCSAGVQAQTVSQGAFLVQSVLQLQDHI